MSASFRVFDGNLLATVSWGRPYKLLNTNLQVHGVQSCACMYTLIGATGVVFWVTSMSCAFAIF